jgi:flagellar basal-body rod protein FlgB
MVNTFARNIDMLHRALDVETLRRQVIANNIANADVPNFKRSDVNFESSLRRALESERDRPAVELERTDPRHLAAWQPVDYRSVRPRRVLDYLSQSKNNGNNVDPEHEFQLSVENQMKYMLLASSANFEFRMVGRAVRS